MNDLISWLRRSPTTRERFDAGRAGFAAGAVWGVMLAAALQVPAPWWGRAIALAALAAVAIRRVTR